MQFDLSADPCNTHIMGQLDRYRQNILSFACLMALLFSFSKKSWPPGLNEVIAGLLLSFFIALLLYDKHCSRQLPIWSICIVELLLTSIASAVSTCYPLLIIGPLSSCRVLGSINPDTSTLESRLLLSCPLLLLSGIAFQPDASIIFLSATATSWAVALLFEKQLREGFAEREELLQKISRKNGILSTLSHEVRTPLTVIQSTIDIILEGRTGELNRQQQDFLRSVESNIRRLGDLSNTILASIKVENDWFTVKLRPIDIRKTIKNLAKQMQPLLDEREQHLRYTFPKLLSRPLVDEGWIFQVLVNLVHNSVKHLQRGGTISISVNENEEGIAVSISDNGSGIATDERLRVFDEYFQGKELSEGRLDGAGLGLSIVQRVVEKHRGKVYFGSVKGMGTTVVFTLPTRKPCDGDLI